MGSETFNLVSPGVQVEEIDNTQRPKNSPKIGPAVIGRTRRGPALKPIQVESFSQFVELFGEPVPGTQVGDVWREGNFQAPSYASYAAQAWLKNSGPLTVIRLLGDEHDDATTAGKAGWKSSGSLGTNAVTNGGAYGLYIFKKTNAAQTVATGTLAAIWYFEQGYMGLSGTLADGTFAAGLNGYRTSVARSGSTGSDYEFVGKIVDNSAGTEKTVSFNFNKNSDRYIRKVFNTNPVIANTDITTPASVKSYWLGETYDKAVTDLLGSTSDTETFGIVVGMQAGSIEGSDYRMGMSPAKTGWVFGQSLAGTYTGVFQPQNQQKLFRFVSHDNGEWDQNNLKVSIKNIKPSQNDFYEYGTFDVEIRSLSDSDGSKKVVESFSDCSLDPDSKNYIAKKIGDMYQVWDYSKNNYRNYGEFPNLSKFVRVEMDPSVKSSDARLLPFGFYGPLRYKTVDGTVTTGTGSYDVASSAFTGSASILCNSSVGNVLAFLPSTLTNYKIEYPKLALRVSSSNGDLANQKDAYFGVVTTRSETSSRKEDSYADMIRAFPVGIDSFAPGTYTEYSFIFTLEDIVKETNNGKYVSGSAMAGTSICAVGGGYNYVLDEEYNRFTMPLFGGFDGVDIKEADPFCNRELLGGSPMTNYAYNSVKRAIDSIADPEVVECNLALMPGITNEALNTHLLNTCENRRECMAIIDLKDVFKPDHETYCSTFEDHFPNGVNSVAGMVTNIKSLAVNTSYGAVYTPWVKIADTISDAQLWVPPSVVALGSYAYTERNSELWFAPAGFTRGGLTDGAGGLPVLAVSEKLRNKDRDELYKVNINPIASFPSQGIVIYGNKTLQVTPSAIDRVNVRRLMIYLKKEIARIASTMLFEQNTKVTWNRFLSKAEPLLRSVKSRFGVYDYKIVLDETTTTPDLIDQNMMYVKVFIKPTRSIEYIKVDMVLTNTGAAFAD